jgi:HK97 gp10 family phage protein
MLRLDVRVSGLEGVQANLRSLTTRGRQALELALDESANALRDDITTSILHEAHTGEMYGKHQASAPGETPASDTGNLVNNIIVDNGQLPNLEVATSSLAPYSEALEYGTKKMAARPFMRPALQRHEASIISRLRAAMARAAAMRGV